MATLARVLLLITLLVSNLGLVAQTDSLKRFGPRLVYLSDLVAFGGKLGFLSSTVFEESGPYALAGSTTPYFEWDMNYMTNASEEVSIVFKGGFGIYPVSYQTPFNVGIFNRSTVGAGLLGGSQWSLGGQYRFELGSRTHLATEAGVGLRYLLSAFNNINNTYGGSPSSLSLRYQNDSRVKSHLYWAGGLSLTLPNLDVLQLLVAYQYGFRDYVNGRYVIDQGLATESTGSVGVNRSHWSIHMHYYISQADRWLAYTEVAMEGNLNTVSEVEQEMYMQHRIERGKSPLRMRSGGFATISFHANGIVRYGPAFYTGIQFSPEVMGNTRWTYEHIWDDRFMLGFTAAGQGIQINYSTDTYFRKGGTSPELRGIVLLLQGGYKVNNGFRNLFDLEAGMGAYLVTNRRDVSGISKQSVSDKDGNIIGYVGESLTVEKGFSPMAELGLSKNIWLGERLALEVGYHYVWMPTRLARFTVTTQPVITAPGIGATWWGNYNHHNLSVGLKYRIHRPIGHKKAGN